VSAHYVKSDPALSNSANDIQTDEIPRTSAIPSGTFVRYAATWSADMIYIFMVVCL
jgi:hypothetical protein